MAAPKRATHQVVKNVYFTPKDGQLEVGTQLTLSDKQAKKLMARGFVVALKDVKTIDVSGGDSNDSAEK